MNKKEKNASAKLSIIIDEVSISKKEEEEKRIELLFQLKEKELMSLFLFCLLKIV